MRTVRRRSEFHPARETSKGLAHGTFLRFFCALVMALPVPLFAETQTGSLSPTPSIDEPFFSYRLQRGFEKPRGVFWRPVLSILVPGLDQWIEGQYRSAAFYSGYATVGLGVAAAAASSINKDSDLSPDTTDSNSRAYMWGNQAYMDAGFVSAFHSFRKAAETKKAIGKYTFLTHEETTGDLLIAPFRFDYLLRPTVLLPLGLLAGIVALDRGSASRHAVWRGDDMLFAGATSVNAGIGEEAAFRGFLMPLFREAWDSDVWSNLMTATIFAAAHLGSGNLLPWPQFALGWYLGWRVQRNEWQLSESVFIHTWWDIIAISAEVAANRGEAVYLPLFRTEF